MMAVNFSPDQAKHILEQTEAGLNRPEIANALGGPNEVKCWSCRIGLNTAGAALIAAAIAAAVATGGVAAVPEIAAIAALTGLSEAVVGGIISSIAAGGVAGAGTAVEAAIEALCKAMKACH